jgi:hypothetical protein
VVDRHVLNKGDWFVVGCVIFLHIPVVVKKNVFYFVGYHEIQAA